ncbi:hypothetical protein [Arthrobacter globiformis]|nr:hypothetical protein [Arthrobacter globiformis]
MTDRAGQVYARVGGVLLGAATGMFAAGLAPGTANWWVIGALSVSMGA